MYCNHCTLYPLPHLARLKPYRHIGGVFAPVVFSMVFYIGGGVKIRNKVRKANRLRQVPVTTEVFAIQGVGSAATHMGRSATDSINTCPMVTSWSPANDGVSPWRQLPNWILSDTLNTPNTTQPGTRRPGQ